MQKTSTPTTTKAWLCLLAVGCLVLLAACGGTPSPTATGTTPTAAPTATPTANPTPSPTPTATPTANPTPSPTPTAIPTANPTPSPTPTAASSGNSVSIMNFSFSPNSLTVKVGTKVTWTNHDSVTHTVTADQGAFNSTVPPGGSFSFTLTKAGTYAYHCNIHPYMMATIVVQ
jgi:plastocyanin